MRSNLGASCHVRFIINVEISHALQLSKVQTMGCGFFFSFLLSVFNKIFTHKRWVSTRLYPHKNFSESGFELLNYIYDRISCQSG